MLSEPRDRCRGQMKGARRGVAVEIARRSEAQAISGTARGVAKRLQVLLPLARFGVLFYIAFLLL